MVNEPKAAESQLIKAMSNSISKQATYYDTETNAAQNCTWVVLEAWLKS